MCLVEASKMVNSGVSCAIPSVNEMRIYTNTKRVRLAREAVLESVLLNHPLDCPICDQAVNVIYKI